MSATAFDIIDRTKASPVFLAQRSDFLVDAGQDVPAQVVIDDPNVSLYCFDDKAQAAIFVETPPDVHVASAPFTYQAQYEYATRLITLPYDEFHQLADALPDPDNLILIYSVGRCGSTLISQALDAVEGVSSLSEPDAYTQITFMRYMDGSRIDDYRRLIRSSTRFLGKHSPTLALKFRSTVIHVGDLFYDVYPQAHNLFLYRNARTWLQSMTSLNNTVIGDIPEEEQDLDFVANLAPMTSDFVARYGRDPLPVEFTSLLWLSEMDKYLKLHAQGIPFWATRYEDIKAQPQAVLAALCETCGLGAAAVEQAYSVFGKDSQAGTPLSQDNLRRNAPPSLGDDDYAILDAILRDHPLIQSADFVAPDTVQFSAGKP